MEMQAGNNVWSILEKKWAAEYSIIALLNPQTVPLQWPHWTTNMEMEENQPEVIALS